MRTWAALALVAATAVAEEPREQAWRAYRIAEAKEAARAPELIALLAAGHGTVRETALDSLIRLKAKVPYGKLEPLLDRHRLEVLVLLALHPDDKGLVAVAERDLTGIEWTLVCNVMAKRKTPGFAAHLLAGVEMRLQVTVHDPGTRPVQPVAVSGGVPGDGRLTVEPGWPPRAIYSLTERETRGAALAPGRHSVYLRRREIETGTGGFGTAGVIRRNARRYEYLQDLLGVKRLPIEARSHLGIAWVGADDFRARAGKRYAAIRSAYRGLVGTCVERKLLDGERARKLAPIIRIDVRDTRAEKQPPLPELRIR